MIFSAEIRVMSTMSITPFSIFWILVRKKGLRSEGSIIDKVNFKKLFSPYYLFPFNIIHKITKCLYLQVFVCLYIFQYFDFRRTSPVEVICRKIYSQGWSTNMFHIRSATRSVVLLADQVGMDVLFRSQMSEGENPSLMVFLVPNTSEASDAVLITHYLNQYKLIARRAKVNPQWVLITQIR